MPTVNPWLADPHVAVISEAPLNVDYPEFGGSVAAAVAVANAAPGSGGVSVYVPAGLRTEPAEVELTRAKSVIFGDGASSVVRFNGADPTGLKIGARWCEMWGLNLIANNATPPSVGHSVVVNGADAKVHNMFMDGFAGVLRAAASAPAARMHVNDISARMSDNSNTNWWWLEGCPGFKAVECHAYGGTAGLNTHAYCRIGDTQEPPAGAANDGLHFTNFICFCDPGSGAPNFGRLGTAYGVDIDGTVAGSNNIRFVDCGFDGTQLAGVRYRGSSLDENNRAISFTRTRFETASGRVADVVHTTGGAQVFQGMAFDGCWLFWGNDPAFVNAPFFFDADVGKGVSIVNNDIISSGNPALLRLFSMGVQGFTIRNNRIYRGGSGPLGCQRIIETTNEPQSISVGGNDYEDPSSQYFKHFPYAAHHGRRYKVEDDTDGVVYSKRADQPLTVSSITMQDVGDLAFWCGPNEKFKVRFVLDALAASVTPDIQFKWTGPDGLSVKWNRLSDIVGVNVGGVAPLQVSGTVAAGSDVAQVQAGLAIGESTVVFEGWVTNGSTAGLAKLRSSQNTSDPALVTIKAGSRLELERDIYA